MRSGIPLTMPVSIGEGDYSIKLHKDITLDIRIGIFIYRNTAGCMGDKNGAQPFRKPIIRQERLQKSSNIY